VFVAAEAPSRAAYVVNLGGNPPVRPRDPRHSPSAPTASYLGDRRLRCRRPGNGRLAGRSGSNGT